MKKFFIKNLWWITALVALFLLVAHSLSLDKINVDNTSIILILIILLSPFISAIKKIKYGEFEAEIDPKEVQKIKDEIESKLPEYRAAGTSVPEIQNLINSIKRLVTSDPIIALAKLRIELEKVLNRLYKITIKQSKGAKSVSIVKIVFELTNKGILASDISGSIREVVYICNRAIHGEHIRQKDAESIIDIGISLLEKIYWQVKEYILEPTKIIPIDKDLIKKYESAKYRLTTIIPYVDNPVKNIRILDQEALNEFLEGYNEFGEFIIEIVKIEK
jgi:hypothetical protein